MLRAMLFRALLIMTVLWPTVGIGYAAREAHVIVAYWALVAMGLHLGLHCML